MNGIIQNFRRSRHVTKPNHMIVCVSGTETKDAAEALLGKSVSWKSPAGKEIKGEIKSTHGNKGAVRVIFEIGMPGQAIGQKVDIN